MNLQFKMIEKDVCLIDADSQEYWPLFPGSPYENLSNHPVFLSGECGWHILDDIYTVFFTERLSTCVSLSMPAYALIGAHLLREMMARNQAFHILAAGQDIACMADALSELVTSFSPDSRIYLAEASAGTGENERVIKMPLREVVSLLGEGALTCMILDADLLQKEGERFLADLLWKISDGGMLFVYGREDNEFLKNHPAFQNFSGYEFFGFLVGEGRVDAGLRRQYGKLFGGPQKTEERDFILRKFEKLQARMAELLQPETENARSLFLAEPIISGIMELERWIALHYSKLQNLDLKWNTNQLKEAAIQLYLALEDKEEREIAAEREWVARIWRAYETKLVKEYGKRQEYEVWAR